MPYALYYNGEKVKEVALLPTIDQSFPVGMEDGYEWRTIVEDETPAHDPVYQIVTVTEAKQSGKKLKKTKKIEDRPNWQAHATVLVEARLRQSIRRHLDDAVLALVSGQTFQPLVDDVNNCNYLKAEIAAGRKPDIATGWSE